MSKVLVTESYLSQIASAIRSKLGGSAEYRPGDMAAAIQAIPTGGITPTGTVNITQNGTHDVTQYANANVNVQPNLQSKTATQNGTVTPDQGYDGLSSVVINVSGGGSSEPGVPSGYQEVQYLQCTDHQGIQLAIDIKGKLICLDISQNSITSSESGFSGCYVGSSSIVEMYLKNGTIYIYSKAPDCDNAIISSITAGQKYRVAYVFLTSGISVFNIGFYRSGMYPFAGKIYRAEVTDPNGGTSLHMLLKPCYRLSDNEPGMYDVINDVFYTNVGSGSFGVGPDVN